MGAGCFAIPPAAVPPPPQPPPLPAPLPSPHLTHTPQFAGDAMIVLWRVKIKPGGENTREVHLQKAKAVAKACKCATKAVEALQVVNLHDKTVQKGSISQSPKNNLRNSQKKQSQLSVHVGVGCGEVTAFHAGGLRSRWEYFIMGQACLDMNAAEGLASKGEIVISKACLEILQDFSAELSITDFSFARKSNGFVQLNKLVGYNLPPKGDLNLVLTPTTIAKLHKSLRSYIPAPIVSSVDEGENLSGDGVLRELCVLFIKLTDLETKFNPKIGIERIGDKFQKAVVAIQEAAYHGRATLRQFIIDDKGAVAIVVVGLPPVTAVKNSSR